MCEICSSCGFCSTGEAVSYISSDKQYYTQRSLARIYSDFNTKLQTGLALQWKHNVYYGYICFLFKLITFNQFDSI
jgi:hypothetical protein